MSEWESYTEAERRLVAARQRLVSSVGSSLTELLRSTLSDVSQRGPALRLIRSLDVEVAADLLEELIDLAGCGHADIALVRELILRVPAPALDARLWPAVDSHVSAGDEEEFRRYAELLTALGREADLIRLVDLARGSSDRHVQEVAADFEVN